jgi:putative endonuclease
VPRPGFWWVYVLERADASWYTGISTDPRRRMEQHRAGKGAKANQVSAPQRLICLEALGSYAQALRREAQVKALSKAAKHLYAADPGSLPGPAETLSSPKKPAPKKSPKKPKKRILKG